MVPDASTPWWTMTERPMARHWWGSRSIWRGRMRCSGYNIDLVNVSSVSKITLNVKGKVSFRVQWLIYVNFIIKRHSRQTPIGPCLVDKVDFMASLFNVSWNLKTDCETEFVDQFKFCRFTEQYNCHWPCPVWRGELLWVGGLMGAPLLHIITGHSWRFNLDSLLILRIINGWALKLVENNVNQASFSGDVYLIRCQFTSMQVETRNTTEGARRSSNMIAC